MKIAGHVEDRTKERSPGSSKEINKIKKYLSKKKLEPTTHSIALSSGAHLVVGPVGKKNKLVPKTVLAPHMKTPGIKMTQRQLKNMKKASLLEKMAAAQEHKDQMKGGLADKKKPEDFDKAQLQKGIKVEMEHTDSERKAKEIAMDHLAEYPNYYSALKKMERGLKKESSLPTLVRKLLR